ncbi:UDP-glucose:O-linked fucose beta-1 [Senna tora]|uniref:UDP-glucose:O-linked fucose beta-1 n=1 Tax=Senna tora TaxID=362788 RepID=A0A834X2T5_9FABA|nr:UDP-glucose:O-linked fucose beta-1 [Senna tora]
MKIGVMVMMTQILKTIMSSYHDHDKNSRLSPFPPSQSGSRQWRQSRTGTLAVAVAALLISTIAWLSLVFSDTATHCLHRLRDWEGSSHFLPWKNHVPDLLANVTLPPPLPFESRGGHNINDNSSIFEQEDLSLKHIVFGVAGSSQLWTRRKEYIRLWWRPNDMRGHVWLEEQVPQEHGDDLLPPIMVSEDISRFRYTNPIGHPSGLRISRIVAESFRLGLPGARWFVLCDDDTIFNVDNLVDVLNKYNSSEMIYIGSPSESHSANTYFSHSMAYGGGGIAISHPLAKALSETLDECIERYPKLYGSDDRLHACITELGVPLTWEHGFHQWDIRGDAHGLLSSHPVAPFVSIHHVEAVDPFYPGLSSLESLKLFTKAMSADPRSFLQRSICYDHARHLTFSVSLGYVVQVLPNIVFPRELERSERTYSAWNGISQRHEFDFDARDPSKSICRKPSLFFLKDARKEVNASWGSYVRTRERNDFKKKIFCFPHPPPLRNVQEVQVLVQPLTKNWHLVPRRLCCRQHQVGKEILQLTVGQCGKGAFSSVY